ncbi:MAG: hypothetical protein K6B40_07055 [Firmicutes bacterium]|nr:hypothetical protein [Bacillota bacterium]
MYGTTPIRQTAVFACALALVWILLSAVCPCAYANMAAPAPADVASSVTFAQNDSIAVRSEVLDIAVHGGKADITATYTMENMTGKPVSTPAMFLAPHMEDGSVSLTVNGQAADFAVESYALPYGAAVAARDWRYVVLTETGAAAEAGGGTVDSVSFTMDFLPGERYVVTVSYAYRLGGYPDYDFNVKMGRIEYYLTPAALWKDFENLTVNLYLDEDMPVLADSNLPFEKVAPRVYRYVSSTLPAENLTIVIDENRWQTIAGFFRSPYLPVMLLYAAPFLLILAAAVLTLVLLHRRRKHKCGELPPKRQ